MHAFVVQHLDITTVAPGTRAHLAIETVRDGLGADMLVPVIVARGARPGPVLGITAVVHGNELNGVPVIHRLLQELDLQQLAGTIVAVPVVNVPGYHRNERRFNDGADLNRTFPGREGGTNAEVFAWRFLDRAIRAMDYLVDLHTASFGRTNSLYIRADLRDPVTRAMAEAFHPQLLLHNRSEDGTLRDAALDLGVHAITVEVGNPQRIQDDLVRHSVGGIQRILAMLKMIKTAPPPPPTTPVRCGRSYWLYTDRGGVLEVFPPLLAALDAGEHIAQVRDIYGTVTRDFHAPEAGVVIGRSTNPVNQTGSRILHLGVPGDPETAPAAPDA